MVRRRFTKNVLPVLLVLIALLAAGAKVAQPRERGWWAKPHVAAPKSEEKSNVPHNPAAVAIKARLDSSSVKRWHIEWNEQTGMPMGIAGESKRYYGSPREIADQFSQEYRALFTGLPQENDPSDVAFVFDTSWYDADPTRPATIVKFQEVFRGVTVYQASVLVHVNPVGRVIWVGGTSYRIDSLDVTPVLSADAVERVLRQALAPDSMVLKDRARLIVFPEVPARLAYFLPNANVLEAIPKFTFGALARSLLNQSS